MKHLKDIQKILVIGDSFSACSNKETDWPRSFAMSFPETIDLDCVGYAGCSWWPVRNYLIEKLNVYTPDIVILCHTEPYRVVTREPTQIGNQANEDPIFVNFYKKYYNPDFYRWATFKWYAELDTILSNVNVPYLIHFFCFSNNSYQFKSGLISEEILVDLQQIQNDPLNLSKRNHFTDENNNKFGKHLFVQFQFLLEHNELFKGYYNFNFKKVISQE